MAAFPSSTTIAPELSTYSVDYEENVKRNESEAGKMQQRDVWGKARFNVTMTFKLKTADADVLLDFWDANRLASFYFFDYLERRVGPLSCGVGDGTNLTFNIPGKLITNPVVQVNGVTKTQGTHYNLGIGLGPNTEDQILFIAGNAPPNGHSVTIGTTVTPTTLRHMFLVRFWGKMMRENFTSTLSRFAVALREEF